MRDRQTDRGRHRQTNRTQRERTETERQTDRQTEGDTDRQDRKRERERERERERREKEREREDRQTDRQTNGELARVAGNRGTVKNGGLGNCSANRMKQVMCKCVCFPNPRHDACSPPSAGRTPSEGSEKQ